MPLDSSRETLARQGGLKTPARNQRPHGLFCAIERISLENNFLACLSLAGTLRFLTLWLLADVGIPTHHLGRESNRILDGPPLVGYREFWICGLR